MARHRKHPRQLMHLFKIVLVAFIVGIMSLGSASLASANGDPAQDETIVAAPAETALTEEVAAEPEQPNVTPPDPDPVEEPAPVAEEVVVVETPAEPAPAPDTPSEVVAPQSAAKVVEEAPAEAADTVAANTNTEPKKVFVCKYVGTPGTDERLQTGDNPISVSVNAIQNNQWNGSVPGWFSDAHDRSYVLAYDTGQPEPDVSACPSPEGEPESEVVTGTVTFATATCSTLMNTITGAGVKGHMWVLTDKNGGTYKSATGGEITTGTVRNGGVPGGLAYGDIVITLEDANLTDNITASPLREVWVTVDPASLECTNPEPTCIDNVNWSYTFDGVRAGTVTAAAGDDERIDSSLKLCDPLAVRAATWPYNLPASGSPSWSQGPAVYNDLLVNTLGTFSYTAPPPTSCVQHDIYAAFVSDGGFESLKLPDRLLGPNNPFEPPFLHDALAGKGPNPTYSHTSSEGCNTPPNPPAPRVEHTGWEDGEWTCGDSEVTQTRTTTTTPFKVVLKDGNWVVVEDTANITVVTDTKTRPLTSEEVESCKPETPSPKVEHTVWQDGTWVCADTKVTQTRTTTTTPYKVVLVEGSTFNVVLDAENVKVTTETQTRPLTASEIKPCPTTVTVSHPRTPAPPALATTGSEVGAFLAVIAGLVTAGAGLLWLNRRKPAAAKQ